MCAIVYGEPTAAELVRKLGLARDRAIGTPTLVETSIVLVAQLGADWRLRLIELLEELDIGPVAFGVVHWREAVVAFERFGRGRHPAGLNFGDCLTYAIAKVAARPLLCVGDDFAQTDIATI